MKGQASPPVVLVTGGAGYLGRVLIRQVLEPGAPIAPREIRVLDTRPVDLEGVVALQGDVRSIDDVRRACTGVDLVFHLAALIDWGQHPPELVRAVNVEGTRNVVRACEAQGVRGLVFTSSLDAIYGGEAIHDGDESLPYPERFPTAYCASKAEAERVVLAASSSRLPALVVRPCSIWGEGDPYHVASMVAMARRGPVVRLGRRPAPTQWVYVENVAHLVALAGRALLEGNTRAAGEVFFAVDFEARDFFDQMEPLVRAAGGRMLPRALALPRLPFWLLSHLMVLAARGLRPIRPFTPLFTPFSVDYVCHEFSIRTDKAARVLGYKPIVSEPEAYARTIAAVRAARDGRAQEATNDVP